MSSLIEYQERRSAFRKRLLAFAVVNLEHIDVRTFLDDAFQHFELKINRTLGELHMLKVNVCLKLLFHKVTVTPEGTETTENQTIYIHTITYSVDSSVDLRVFYNEMIKTYILTRIDDVVMRGSGFTLSRIEELTVQVNQHEPLFGTSYIKTPKYLESKKAILNVKNNDDQCFKYAILSAKFPVKSNANAVSSYLKHINKLNFNGIQFPVEIQQITKFEKQNPDISVNVYIFDKREVKVFTLRLTKEVKTLHINLMLLHENEKKHYCLIKSMSRLLGGQMSKNRTKKHFCFRCLNYFIDLYKFEAHKVECNIRNDCVIEMPTTENNKMAFKNYKNQLQVPFIIYADIEALLKSPEQQPNGTDKTIVYQQHEAYNIAYYFKCSYDDKKSYYRSNRGKNCIEWFVKELYGLSKRVESILNSPTPLNMSMEDEVLFAMTQECEICGKPYTSSDVRVRDHSHLTGKYRGSAHNECNLLYRESRIIPVVFHNLTDYDAHFLITKLAIGFNGNIDIIPINEQRYISFTKKVMSVNVKHHSQLIKLRFIDSFRFMALSLDELSSFLPQQKKKILFKEYIKFGMNVDQIEMLSRKGVLCYDYIDSWEKLNQETFPLKSQFFSKLTDSHISDKNYDFAHKVWKTFNIKSLGEYSDLYLKTDVLLLADVFENFRENCYNIYQLDPAHYFTAPGLSFDAMLKFTKIEIELLSDVDMFLFIEKGVRGGISQCSKRYSKANNKYMDDFDQSQEPKYLIYLDANNLYGYSMTQYLPLNGFCWVDADAFDVATILSICHDSSKGYIFEVDLEYPQELHDLHQDYPLCAENGIVPGTKKDRKLLLTLFNKTKYVIHYRMLQFVLQQGLVLKKIHRVVQFQQSQWLKPYIDLNTDLRSKATNEFEINFYKLLVNAIYGKTMENLRSRVDIRLRTNLKGRYGINKMISMPNFKRSIVFNENLVGVELSKTNIKMNRPITIGMSILDLSKVLMYDFHYNHMKKEYGDNIEIMYTGILLS